MLLLDLDAPGHAAASLFDMLDAPDDGLMQAIDQINARYGRGTARLGMATCLRMKFALLKTDIWRMNCSSTMVL